MKCGDEPVSLKSFRRTEMLNARLLSSTNVSGQTLLISSSRRRVIHQRSEQHSAACRQWPTRPPQMQCRRLAVSDRLLPRRLLIDAIPIYAHVALAGALLLDGARESSADMLRGCDPERNAKSPDHPFAVSSDAAIPDITPAGWLDFGGREFLHFSASRS